MYEVGVGTALSYGGEIIYLNKTWSLIMLRPIPFKVILGVGKYSHIHVLLGTVLILVDDIYVSKLTGWIVFE